VKVFRQAGSSILLALASLTIVLGGVLLSLGENYMPEAPAGTSTVELLAPTPAIPSVSAQFPTSTAVPSPTSTFITPASCPLPPGWILMPVQAGQTLGTLAVQYHISVSELKQANCLLTDDLPANALLALPPLPTNTAVPRCGPPPGYVLYTVKAGEYPYKLSQAFGITLAQFLQANCMRTGETLHIGQQVYVPNVATRAPSKTPTITLTSVIIIFPTNTLIPTQTPLPSETAIPTSTWTPTPTSTSTPIPPLDTATPTATAFPTPTYTPMP
jgi:LysM repeat protein